MQLKRGLNHLPACLNPACECIVGMCSCDASHVKAKSLCPQVGVFFLSDLLPTSFISNTPTHSPETSKHVSRFLLGIHSVKKTSIDLSGCMKQGFFLKIKDLQPVILSLNTFKQNRDKNSS